jgi:uncharacterized protein
VTHTILVLLVALFSALGLVLIALGLPGIWLIVLAVVGAGAFSGFNAIGWGTIALAVGLAGLGELFELWLGFGLARRYGGSKRAGWGALLGGLAGALVGVPVPVLGSVIGGLIGAFAGATLLEYSRSRATGVAVRAGWGALLGRVAATAAKMTLGIVIAVVAIFRVL